MIKHYRRGRRARQYREQKRKQEKTDRKLNEIEEKVSIHVPDNTDAVKKILGDSGDLVTRSFHIAGKEAFSAAVVYIDGMVDNAIVDNFILRSTMSMTRDEAPDEPVNKASLYRLLERYGLHINEIQEVEDLKQAVKAILYGDTVFFVEGNDRAFIANTKGWERRGVEEPQNESVVRGPREGFTETLRTNTALIRKRLKDPDLRIKQMTIGERTNTYIALAYIDGVVNRNVLREVERRLNDIQTDGILESGYIEQYIQDSDWSPFPLLQNTERPDKAVANLLEGRVVIIVDDTPFVLIAPAVFSQFYHSPEDYYERFWIGTFVRMLRLLSLFVTLLAPALYIAFSSFHPEMIPSRLVIAMAAGRSTVPFPSIVEALIMEITIEILREASVRLPGPIGPTIGIVGALVVGQAAVQAGIVSPIMVIVVALTTIGSFATPSYNAAIALRLLRFPLMLIAAVFGIYGIMLFILLILLHLVSLKSFGVPYMAPISPSSLTDMKDTVIRVPLNYMFRRPSLIQTKNQRRRETGDSKAEEENSETKRDKP